MLYKSVYLPSKYFILHICGRCAYIFIYAYTSVCLETFLYNEITEFEAGSCLCYICDIGRCLWQFTSLLGKPNIVGKNFVILCLKLSLVENQRVMSMSLFIASHMIEYNCIDVHKSVCTSFFTNRLIFKN